MLDAPTHASVVGAVAAHLTGPGSRTVLLSGLPGVGKSTTVATVAGERASAGVVVRRVEADEMSRSRPFGLVADLLGVDADYPPRPETADRMVEAVERLCAGGPVLLCADDLHQADADSLALLGWLADMTRDLPLSLLLTRRPLPLRADLAVLATRPDVHLVELTGLAPDDLDALVVGRCGAPPDQRVRDLLAMTGGNPFHVHVLLDDLQRRGLLETAAGELTTSATTADTPASVQAGARAHLALLEPPARELLQVLAVWGAPATPEQLAAVTGSRPAALVGAIQAAVGSGVIRWTDGDRLAFHHDLYRDVVHADLDPPLRALLHAACAAEIRARGGLPPQVLQQEAEADEGAGARSGVEAALQVAVTDLVHAPAQAADLLATAAVQAAELPAGDDRARLADRIAVARAGVLAAAGRMTEALQVAGEGLQRSADPAVGAELARIRLHQIVSSADMPAALAEIDRTLAAGPPPQAREALAQLRRWTVLLDGRERVGDGVATGRTGAALLTAATELFLAGHTDDGLRLVEEAVRAREGSPEWADGPSAPATVAWFALHAEGVEAARKRSVEARRLARERGHGWQLPLHLYIAAGIDYVAGRWDDALAIVDTGLEASAVTQSGLVSPAVGVACGIRVRRGELDTASAGLDRWRLRGLPEVYGLPLVGLAEMLLDEARGRPDAAAEAAGRTWAAALGTGRAVWTVNAGPDTARVALRAGDTALLARVAADTAAAPMAAMAGMSPAADLVQAIAGRDPDRATAAASAYASRGHLLGELGAWEEAAVAAAARGRDDQARSCAARCANVAGLLGAAGVERRLTARLREHAIRLGATGRRNRPSSGWDSLTPTELQVAGLVGKGLTSPQIAARMYLSPRTVQTHVSHSLHKLGIGSRVELAALVARQH
jgi:DNA-binding CsgD family transcriptional regulator